jgi:hypothetical protein
MKLYSHQAPYQGTKVKTIQTIQSVNSLLKKYGIAKKPLWILRPTNYRMGVEFAIDVKGKEISVQVHAPIIWHRTRKGTEYVAWDQAFRVLYWYLKSQLEMTVLGRTLDEVFLPHIRNQLSQREIQKLEEKIMRRMRSSNILSLEDNR